MTGGGRCAVMAQEKFEAMCAGKEDDPRFAEQAPRAAFIILGQYFTAFLSKQ